jgi:hypothetical protein
MSVYDKESGIYLVKYIVGFEQFGKPSWDGENQVLHNTNYFTSYYHKKFIRWVLHILESNNQYFTQYFTFGNLHLISQILVRQSRESYIVGNKEKRMRNYYFQLRKDIHIICRICF